MLKGREGGREGREGREGGKRESRAGKSLGVDYFGVVEWVVEMIPVPDEIPVCINIDVLNTVIETRASLFGSGNGSL